MGRQKRNVPKGRLRLIVPANPSRTKTYSIYYEYLWNTKTIRRCTDIKCLVNDWNPKGNMGRGELRPSFGVQYKHINASLISKIDKIDALLLEYETKHPRQLTSEIVKDFLQDKPISRIDKGGDFVEFAKAQLKSKYSLNRIGHSRYENGISALRMLSEFLVSKNKGTHKPDGIYIAEMTPSLLNDFVEWKRNVKGNKDETINHSLTPILYACQKATELGMIDSAINAQIQDIRIVIKPSIDEEEAFDEKYLSKEQLSQIVEYYGTCDEPRRKEYLEMFLFAFHACGLRVIDVMTLQWANVDFEKAELRKCLVKTRNRHVIPLSTPAMAILNKWYNKNGERRFVFGLLKDDFDLNDESELYRVRNSITRSINQSITVVGRNLEFPFPLTMHVARHTFSVLALNDGISMSIISRLLGHSSTDVTEKVYAKFLPSTLASEIDKLQYNFLPEL